MKGRTVLRKTNYMHGLRGMRLTHDGVTSHTARMTINLLLANRVNVSATQITDLNRIDHIWDFISCVVRRRYPANVIQFEQFVRYGWKGTYLYAVRGFDA